MFSPQDLKKFPLFSKKKEKKRGILVVFQPQVAKILHYIYFKLKMTNCQNNPFLMSILICVEIPNLGRSRQIPHPPSMGTDPLPTESEKKHCVTSLR